MVTGRQVDRWTGDKSTGNLILTYLAFCKSKIGATVQKLQALLYRKYFRVEIHKLVRLDWQLGLSWQVGARLTDMFKKVSGTYL